MISSWQGHSLSLTEVQAFVFTDTTGNVASSVSTSNTITVAGLGTGASVPVTVSGAGQYSKNGEAYTSAPGTAVNGDTFSLQHTNSAAAATSTSTTLTVSKTSDTFTSTTT